MDKIGSVIGFLSGLPPIPKIIASLIVVGIAAVILFMMWQPQPKAAPASLNFPEASAATPIENPSEPAKVHKQEPSEPKSVQIGNVSSTNQSGGVTAGYIGSLDQK